MKLLPLALLLLTASASPQSTVATLASHLVSPDPNAGTSITARSYDAAASLPAAGSIMPEGTNLASEAKEVNSLAGAPAESPESRSQSAWVNLFDSTKSVPGALRPDGTINLPGGNWTVTGKMYYGGAPYLISNVNLADGNKNQASLFYAADGVTIVGMMRGTPIVAGVPFAAPTNGMYFQTYASQHADISTTTNTPFPWAIYAAQTLPPATVPIRQYAQPELAGKVFVTFTDSIFVASNINVSRTLATETGMVKKFGNEITGVTTQGVFAHYSGGTLAGKSDGTFTLAGNTGAQDLAGVDYVIVSLGGNNLLKPSQANSGGYGAYTDTASTASMAGYVRFVLSNIYSANPMVKVIWVGPYVQARRITQGFQLYPMPSVIQMICGDYGASFLDMSTESGINTYNAPTTLMDGVHLSPLGRDKLFLPRLIRFITQYAQVP